jgi:outer membrane protein
MKASVRVGSMLFGAAVLMFSAGGCFSSQEQVYSEIEAGRQLAFQHWREAVGEENLPKIQGRLGIADAVRVALAYNQGLQQVVQEKDVANGEILQAYSEGLPTVDFSADYTRMDKTPTISLGTTSFPAGQERIYTAQFTITQPLFNGAAVPAIRGARIFRYMSDESVRQAVQDVVLRVAQDYYRVLLAQELYKVQQSALAFAEANLKDVQEREVQGVAIRYDELRARLEVSTVKADLIRQHNARSRALTTLLRDMGASQQSKVDLTGELAYQPLEPTFEKAVEIAFRNQPAVIRAALDVRLQHEVLLGLWASYLPKLDFWALAGGGKPDPHNPLLNKWENQWQSGLRLTWTLFDGLKREGKILQQKAVERQSAITLSDTEQRLLQDVKNALLDLADADQLVRSQQDNLQQANEALRLVEVGARQGVNTELEMLDARSALTRARGLYYQALYAHVTARLELQRALGVIGPPPGVGTVPKAVPSPTLIKAFEKTPPGQPAPAGGR